jgi:hypothetical protein
VAADWPKRLSVRLTGKDSRRAKCATSDTTCGGFDE